MPLPPDLPSDPMWIGDHLDEPEVQQYLFEAPSSDEGGLLTSVFDSEFSGHPHSEMYRSWVCPEMFPGQKPPLLTNWHPEDLQMFVGGDRSHYEDALR